MRLVPQSSVAASNVPAESDIDQRTQSDRRQKPTSAWAAFPPAGQRMACRRASEHGRPYFVDRFSSAMFIVILMLISASIVDAILTIQLIEAGAREINPLMDRLLDHGILPFLLVKYVLTVAGLPLLLIFQNHYMFGTRLRVGYLIPMAVALYAILIGYQLVLMHKYVGLQAVIPCQSAGTREFGEITEFAPILQKGDNFRPPKNSRERQRYMAEFLTGMPTPGGAGPQATFIREVVCRVKW